MTLESTDALTRHAAASTACEVRVGIPEGVDSVKMNRISAWGVSWEKIYEILFPGREIPSPCEPGNQVNQQKNANERQTLKKFRLAQQLSQVLHHPLRKRSLSSTPTTGPHCPFLSKPTFARR